MTNCNEYSFLHKQKKVALRGRKQRPIEAQALNALMNMAKGFDPEGSIIDYLLVTQDFMKKNRIFLQTVIEMVLKQGESIAKNDLVTPEKSKDQRKGNSENHLII